MQETQLTLLWIKSRSWERTVPILESEFGRQRSRIFVQLSPIILNKDDQSSICFVVKKNCWRYFINTYKHLCNKTSGVTLLNGAKNWYTIVLTIVTRIKGLHVSYQLRRGFLVNETFFLHYSWDEHKIQTWLQRNILF